MASIESGKVSELNVPILKQCDAENTYGMWVNEARHMCHCCTAQPLPRLTHMPRPAFYDAHRPVDSEGKAKKIKVSRRVCMQTIFLPTLLPYLGPSLGAAAVWL